MKSRTLLVPFTAFLLLVFSFSCGKTSCDFDLSFNSKYGKRATLTHNKYVGVSKYIEVYYRQASCEYFTQDVIWRREEKSAGNISWNDTLTFAFYPQKNGLSSQLIYKPFSPNVDYPPVLQQGSTSHLADTIFLSTSPIAFRKFISVGLKLNKEKPEESEGSHIEVTWTYNKGVEAVVSEIDWIRSFVIED